MLNCNNLISNSKNIFLLFLPLLFFNAIDLVNNYLILYITDRLYITTIYKIFFHIFYKYICYVVVFIYTYKNLPKVFYLLGYKYSNLPTHNYISLLSNCTYLLLSFLLIITSNSLLTIIINTLIYSIYISQITYLYLDSKKHDFHNCLQLYNSNATSFNIIGVIYSSINMYFSYKLSLIWLSFYTLMIFPIMLSIPYKTTSCFNYFYIQERLVSSILRFINLKLES